jgi:hypothetical protein
MLDDPVTDFALKHDVAVCSLALVGAIAMVLGFSHILCVALQSAPSWSACNQSLLGIHLGWETAYARVSTDEVAMHLEIEEN